MSVWMSREKNQVPVYSGKIGEELAFQSLIRWRRLFGGQHRVPCRALSKVPNRDSGGKPESGNGGGALC